jgi:hypothetical protein
LILGVVVGVPILALIGVLTYATIEHWQEDRAHNFPVPVWETERHADPTDRNAYCLRITRLQQMKWVGDEHQVSEVGSTRFRWEDVKLYNASEPGRWQLTWSKAGEMKVGDEICGLRKSGYYELDLRRVVFFKAYPNCSESGPYDPNKVCPPPY